MVLIDGYEKKDFLNKSNTVKWLMVFLTQLFVFQVLLEDSKIILLFNLELQHEPSVFWKGLEQSLCYILLCEHTKFSSDEAE